jgi:hypothetical protein
MPCSYFYVRGVPYGRTYGKEAKVNLIVSRFRLTIGKSIFQFTQSEGVSRFLFGYADGLKQRNRPLDVMVKMEKLNHFGELFHSIEEPIGDLLMPGLSIVTKTNESLHNS